MSSRPVALPTAPFERAADGTPFSPEFRDVYHSSQGGLAQARHVFLAGNGLPRRWQGRDAFTILETGFGLGLNFLAAWDAWRADASRCARLHFVSVEHRPFTATALAAALAPFAEVSPLATALAAAWPPPLAGFHRLHFDDGRVILTLLLGEAGELLPQLVGAADALFLDGFAPARNPEAWSPGVVRELARIAAPGATLATWTVAAGVRAALSGAGFEVEKREGFGHKREMLAGRRPGAAEPRAPERQAVVVGGGLSGMLVADRLAARQWSVMVLEARSGHGPPKSGLLRPVVNLRDAINARISRSAFLYALQHLRALQHDGYHLLWERCGILQLAQDADEAARFAAIAASQAYPESVLRFVDAAEATRLAGRPVRGPGWFFPSGAVISPPSFGMATMARAGGRVRRVPGCRVARIAREGGRWQALGPGGETLAEAPTLVLANGAPAKDLWPAARLALSSVRGQLTYLPAGPGRALGVGVSGSGYVAPVPGGGLVVGATYQHDDADDSVRVEDHRQNLSRAESMLPGIATGLDTATLEGWAGHRTTVPDRLPVFGASAEPGLSVATGLGSRGILWAPIAAELLACELEGEPLPLPRDYAGAISPRRFLS